MVSATISAFEVYQKTKQAKKKSAKKKNKVKEVKVNPQIVAELQKVAEVNEIKKKKAKVNDEAREHSSFEASGECATNVSGMLLSAMSILPAPAGNKITIFLKLAVLCLIQPPILTATTL